MSSKYFIMGWDNDSEEIRYKDFYFVGDLKGNLILFDSIEAAESVGHKCCKYCNICSWHSYIMGKEILQIKKLRIKE